MPPAPEPIDPLARGQRKPADVARLQAVRGQVPLLIWLDEHRDLKILELRADSYAVGRGQSDVCLVWDKKVSRTHAMLERVGPGYWTIRDDELSKHGTEVAGVPVLTRARLRDEHRIRVGNTLLAFLEATPGNDLSATEDDERFPNVEKRDLPILLALCRERVLNAGAPVPNNTIAAELNIALSTVTAGIGRMLKLTGAANRHKLVDLAIRQPNGVGRHSY